ncbi:MAG TPA: helix-turn-helix transcriptional regulator [Xanthobacteraceae bacterium]|nr:helix-turn-helix transcriptional regulator [Xanthobacteraceae bacterium]
MSTPRDAQQVPFGVLLRRWRQRRRMTQMDLAAAANSSTRHLSCLETGRAQPSREMVVRLAEYLDMPLRERNLLLLAAGFAPAYQERSFAELASARQAIEQVVQAHKPYPAFAVDRHWNIVLSNRALPQLYVDVSPELLRPPVNAIRLMLHPLGMASRIVNLPAWRWHVISVLRQQFEARAEPGVQALLAEILTYPLPTGRAAVDTEEGARRYATPLRIATEEGVVSFLNTITIFGTPTDVTLSELALEMLFPADAETVAIVRRLSADDDARGSSDATLVRAS